MKISCEVRDIKENNPESISPGRYLYIYLEQNKTVISIPFSEFHGRFEEAKRGSELSIPDPQVVMGDPTIAIPEKNNTPDFKKIMDFLVGKIAITDADFNNDELIIESSLSNFLELPWEEITQKEIFVLRKVVGEKKSIPTESPNNLLFIISNSHRSGNGELPDLKDKLRDEVKSILGEVINAIPKEFKINNVGLSKHTTKGSFQSLSWDSYNYIHFIMHGDENGGLCLEKPEIDNYTIQDIMTVDEVTEILNGKNILLLFLSFCYSGGGLNSSDKSLAFQIANKGIAKYSIGYRHRVGEDSASTFAEIFYRILLSGFENLQPNRIENVYKKSLSEYYKKLATNRKYTPILYINS